VGHERLEPPFLERFGDALADVGIGVRDDDEALGVVGGAGLGRVRRSDVSLSGCGGIGTAAFEAVVPMKLPSYARVLMGFARLRSR
jgi:hypothetical protein